MIQVSMQVSLVKWLHGTMPCSHFCFTYSAPAVIVPPVVQDITPAERNPYMQQFSIETDHIKLDSFLKLVNIVGSGGEAKMIIADGQVAVNGETETRRGRKLYPGDRVSLEDHVFMVSRAG